MKRLMGIVRATNSSRASESGMTLIEVLTVTIIIGILTGIAIYSDGVLLVRARDAERANDVRSIARELERYYRANAANSSGGPSYPPTSIGTEGIARIINSADITTAPRASANSVIMASGSAAQTPTATQYIYQPLTSDDTLCSSAPCVRFVLYYFNEATNNVIVVNSVRQQ